MGYKKPAMRGLAHHLGTPSTIGMMKRDGWAIMARCTTCQIDLRVDLEVLIRMNGSDLVLFGRTSKCRRMHCDGRMIFMGTPPGEVRGMFWVLRAIPDRGREGVGSAP